MILTREAEERRLIEEKVLAMRADRCNSPSSNTHSLPLPPRAQTLPNPPSPSPSQKEGGSSWWALAKNKLTPTREPLTPAQEIIRDAKARDKEQRKVANGKGKEKEKEWPAIPGSRDSAFLGLNIPPMAVTRKPVPASPSSPTPSRSILPGTSPLLTPSPMRAGESSYSPSREAPPLYAQFNAQGTLDVPGTLLTIAKRFEKLEKWTVGHVRALEERMGDVERWLVDKEKEKEATTEVDEGSDRTRTLAREMSEIREDISEVQGRVGELGREMAKLATSPANLSSGPSVQQTRVVQPQTSTSSFVETISTSPLGMHTPRIPSSSSAVESTSPPIASQTTGSKKTRLPYPTGDYTAPSNAATKNQGSPTGSMSSATGSISGLPGIGLGITGLPPAKPSGLPAPPKPSYTRRPNSVSPTPRKRYTVALGGPIVPPSTEEAKAPTKKSNAALATDPTNGESTGNDFHDETIGKSASKRFNGGHVPSPPSSSSPSDSQLLTPSNPNRRNRTQSAYGFSSIASASPNTLAQAGLRSPKSTDKFGLEGKFVDPLVLRKQERKETGTGAGIGKVPGKVPVGQLVAFFDGEK
jgi:hypothetical protein